MQSIVSLSFQVPNIGEEVKIEKSIVQFYNFRSMVAKLANELKALISPEPMDVIDNGSPLSLYSLPPSSSSVSSVSPYYDEIDTLRCDFLKGMYSLNYMIIKKQTKLLLILNSKDSHSSSKPILTWMNRFQLAPVINTCSTIFLVTNGIVQ